MTTHCLPFARARNSGILPDSSFSRSPHATRSKIQWLSFHSKSRTQPPSHCFPSARWSKPPCCLTWTPTRVPRQSCHPLPCPPTFNRVASAPAITAQNLPVAPLSLTVKVMDLTRAYEARSDQAFMSLPLSLTMALDPISSLTSLISLNKRAYALAMSFA